MTTSVQIVIQIVIYFISLFVTLLSVSVSCNCGQRELRLGLVFFLALVELVQRLRLSRTAKFVVALRNDGSLCDK